MYTLVSAVLKKKGLNTTYKEVDVSNILFNDLVNDYLDGYIKVINPYLYHPIHVSLSDLKSNPRYPTINLKIPQWLQAIGNITLNGTEIEPDLSTRYVYAGDAFHCGFNVDRTLNGVDDAKAYPLDMMTNIKISKPLINLSDLKNKTLITVNGLLHIYTPLEDGILVQDGAKSLDICGINHVGVLSFAAVGNVSMHIFQQHMIGKANPDYDLADGIYVHLGRSLVNKTLLLSIAGFLHIADDTYSIVNEEMGIIRINPRKLDLVKRLAVANKYIDISGLGLSRADKFPDVLVTEEVYHDRVLTKLLLLSQSFAILVDATGVHTEKYLLDDINIQGVFEHHQAAVFPFVDPLGRLQEYVCIRNDIQWQVQIHDGEYGVKHYSWGDLTQQPMTNDRVADNDFSNISGALLKIGFTGFS